MKKINYILTLLVLVSAFGHSQITNQHDLLLVKTARFIYSQQQQVNTIKTRFSNQKAAAEAAELAFRKNFGTAIAGIEAATKKLLGDKYDSFLKDIDLEMSREKQLVSEKEVDLFIKSLYDSARGSIESPVLETLLAYQYLKNPVDEFLANNVATYQLKEDEFTLIPERLTITLPASWIALDFNSPTILKRFKSEYGTGNAEIAISIASADTTIQNADIQKATYSNNSSISYNLTTKNKQENSVQKRQLIKYITLPENVILKIKCTTYGTSTNDLALQYKKYEPLYESIIQSIEFGNEQQKDALISFKY